MNQILILKEKHGEEYYDASTKEKLAEACLKVLKDRYESGYYYQEPKIEEYFNPSKESQEILNMTPETLDSLPDTLREDFKLKQAKLKTQKIRATVQYDNEKEWFDSVKNLINLPVEEAIKKTVTNRTKTVSKPLAYHLLAARDDYEYESIRLVTLK